MGLKIKFPKVSRENRETFSLAMQAFKKGEFDECYNLLKPMADVGDARACYCAAVLNLNENVSARSGESFLHYLKKAYDLKYPLAAGVYAAYYFETDQTAELAALCRENKKCADGRFLTFLAIAHDGFLGDEFAENPKLAQKTYALAKAAIEGAMKLGGASEEWEENDLYLGSAGWARRHSYAFLHRMLMLSYRYADVYQNRELFRAAYKTALEYGGNNLFLFGVHKINAQVLMRDIMGLSDLKAVNATMVALRECFSRFSDEEKESIEETYDELFSEYEEYFEKESARLKRLNLHANENFEQEFAGRGAMDMISDLARGVERWANTPSPQTHTYYEIDGKRYEKDSQGYLRDENGLGGDVRVDDVGRVYDSKDNELGYFGTDGIFMPKR